MNTITQNNSAIILRPRITEKSGIHNEALNVYTFEVSNNSTKHTIEKEIAVLYKVVPTKVTIINQKPKNVFVRGKAGRVSGFKKAMVYLKKGDKINLG